MLKLEMATERPSAGDAAGDGGGEPAGASQKFDAALIFPPDFAKRLEAYRKAIHDDAPAKQAAYPL